MTRIGYYQFAPKFGAVKQNLDQIISALKNVQADLIVLPELAITGYYFANREELATLAEDPQSSSSVEGLTALCKERNLHLVIGFAERAKEKLFNSALLLGPKGLRHTYRKLHLFNTEKEYFDAGDVPLEVVDVNGAKLGIMVCFDWRFPEVARTLALRGADILCHPSNLVMAYCQQAMVTRCLENSVFAVTTNRYGTETRPRGALTFTGQSQIVGPRGELLQRGPENEDQLYIAEIDLAQARNKAATPANHLLNDRRPEFYS